MSKNTFDLFLHIFIFTFMSLTYNGGVGISLLEICYDYISNLIQQGDILLNKTLLGWSIGYCLTSLKCEKVSERVYTYI